MDENRELPVNFDPAHYEVFQRLPQDALPQGPCIGKSNYTISKIMNGVLQRSPLRIEVHLREGRFFVKRDHDGQVVTNSPGITWAQAGSIQQAWDDAKRKAKWE